VPPDVAPERHEVRHHRPSGSRTSAASSSAAAVQPESPQGACVSPVVGAVRELHGRGLELAGGGDAGRLRRVGAPRLQQGVGRDGRVRGELEAGARENRLRVGRGQVLEQLERLRAVRSRAS
jgi:hypothetical protein